MNTSVIITCPDGSEFLAVWEDGDFYVMHRQETWGAFHPWNAWAYGDPRKPIPGQLSLFDDDGNPYDFTDGSNTPSNFHPLSPQFGEGDISLDAISELRSEMFNDPEQIDTFWDDIWNESIDKEGEDD